MILHIKNEMMQAHVGTRDMGHIQMHKRIHMTTHVLNNPPMYIDVHTQKHMQACMNALYIYIHNLQNIAYKIYIHNCNVRIF